LVQELLEVTLPQFQKELQGAQKDLELMATTAGTPPPATASIQNGLQKYTDSPMPALAIYAVPKDLPAAAVGGDEARRAALEASDTARTEAQAKRFESGVPSAHVVRLPHAGHHVFLSNEADVMREMRAFLDSLR